MIEDILARLEKVRRTGPNNWLACCPAHDDRSPSFTLHAGDDGRIVQFCHAGCSFEEIVGAVGLGYEPWFPPKQPEDFKRAIKRPFPAGDVLEALSAETMIVAVAAGNIASGLDLSDDERLRLFVAYERIFDGRRLALGR